MNRSFYSILSLFLFFSLVFPRLVKSQDKLEIAIINGKCSGSCVDNSESLLDGSSTEISLNLADAVYLALEQNRDLKIAYLQRILDKKQLAEALSQFNPTFIPQLSVSSNNNQNGNNQTNNLTANLSANLNWRMPTGGIFSLTLQGQNQLSRSSSLDSRPNTGIFSQGINLSFSQPLLRGFSREFNGINITRARLAERANILNIKNTVSQIITNTVLSYRNLLLAQERLKIEQISVENSKKDLERLQALFEFGRIPKNDLVERQADIAQQEVNLVNTQSALEQAITDLNKILDLPVTKKLIAVETPEPPIGFNLPSYAEMLELVLANSSAYINALNGVENAQLNIINANNQQQWDLRFNFSYGFNSATDTENISNLNSSFTLSREFGNLSQDNAIEKSKISLQSAYLTLENAKKNIEEDLKSKIRTVEDTFRQIKLAQQARQLAETRLSNAKERMRLSSNISMTDIINFEKSLVDAKNQELNAIINHLNSVTQLEQFLGITLEKWVRVNSDDKILR
jgi:outer membrane protein TolC